MKKKLQIFISSTYSDLHDERQAAVSAIPKAGHIPAGMELFTAGDESQMETIKRWIDESDVFMLILGGRYGSIEPNTSLSYTELEYDYAVNAGKPYFAVVIEESALDQKVRERGKEVIETENVKELAAFRKKVLSRTSAFFKDMRDISLAVHETISDFLVRYDFKGWVSGDEIPDIQSFTDQINKLREENKRLAEENDAFYKGSVFTSSEEIDFQFIHQKLNREIKLTFKLSKKEPDQKTSKQIAVEIYEVNLLKAILYYVNIGIQYYEYRLFDHYLSRKFKEQHDKAASFLFYHGGIDDDEMKLGLELRTYGLIRHTKRERFDRMEDVLELTEKIFRFNYWLNYNNYPVEDVSFKLISSDYSEQPD